MNKISRQTGQRPSAQTIERDRLRDFSCSSSDWFWECDADLRFSWFSENSGAFLGIAPSELIGKTRREIADADEMRQSSKWSKHLATLEAHRPFRNFEYRIHTDGGGFRWLSVSGTPYFGTNGEFLGYRGSGTEITKIKQAEQSLKLHASVFQHSQEAIVITDAATVILVVNPAFSAMTGYAPDELIGKRTSVLRSGEQDRAFYEGMWRTLGISGKWRGEIRNRRKSGEVYSALLDISAVQDDDGCVLNYVGLSSDITDVKLRELAIRQRESEAKSLLLQSSLESVPQGIIVFDRRGQLAAWNDAFFSICGLPEHLEGREMPLQEFLDVSPRLFSTTPIAENPFWSEESENFEHEFVSGKTVLFSRSPMPDGGFVMTAIDVSEQRRSETETKEMLEHHKAIFDNAHIGIVFLRKREIISCNQRMAEIFGYSSPNFLIKRSTEVLYPSRETWEADGKLAYGELLAKGVSDREIVLRRCDGSPVWIHRTGRPLDPLDPYAGSIWVYSDITDIKRNEEQLKLTKLLFENSHEALLITDHANRIVSVNQAFTEITGYSCEEVIGASPALMKSDVHPPEFYRAMWEALSRDGHWAGEIFDRRRNGEVFPKWLTISVVKNSIGKITNYVAAFADITERKAAEDRIRHLAHHDTLTGLPNRSLLRDRFEQSMLRIERNGGQLAVCFFDLDHFKRVNDTYGHRFGDELIIEATKRITTNLRQSDTVCRLGGDEFIILLESAGVVTDAAVVAQKILRSVEEPVEIEGHVLTCSASIGIAVAPNDGSDYDTLLQKADAAMYHSKASGRAACSFFDERMNKDSAPRLDIAFRLRKAIERDEFHLVYQPQYALADRRLVGVEALLRWRSAGREEESPSRFIPVAEETGMIVQIGEWVLNESLRQVRRWMDAGTPLRVAVNVSAVQIHRDDFATVLERALLDSGADPALVEIELTESAIMGDTEDALNLLDRVGRLGVSVAIDDFGTGYSSLAYLQRFHVGKLKVDRSFVRELPYADESRALAEAIVRMGHSLKLTVIAEGVESEEQCASLTAMGCDQAQGFLLGRPVPAEEICFEAWVLASHRHDDQGNRSDKVLLH